MCRQEQTRNEKNSNSNSKILKSIVIWWWCCCCCRCCCNRCFYHLTSLLYPCRVKFFMSLNPLQCKSLFHFHCCSAVFVCIHKQYINSCMLCSCMFNCCFVVLFCFVIVYPRRHSTQPTSSFLMNIPASTLEQLHQPIPHSFPTPHNIHNKLFIFHFKLCISFYLIHNGTRMSTVLHGIYVMYPIPKRHKFIYT